MASTKNILGFDLGGTNLRAAVISPEGEILEQNRLPVTGAKGFPDLLKLFEKVIEPFQHKWEVASVASAGPLDPVKGVLLDPTNFLTNSKGWGVLPLVEKLEALYKVKVHLENDAAAALLAEVWKGAAQGKNNVTLITLGTGVGTAFYANGKLVRSGRNLHTEASHIPLNAWDKEHPCGCGAYGCIEAYLSGTHFAEEVSRALGRSVSGEELAELGRKGDKTAKVYFTKYGERLALAVRAFAKVFSSELIVLGGGFSANADLFLEITRQNLPGLFERERAGVDLLPQIARSPIYEVAGLVGAARVALLA